MASHKEITIISPYFNCQKCGVDVIIHRTPSSSSTKRKPVNLYILYFSSASHVRMHANNNPELVNQTESTTSEPTVMLSTCMQSDLVSAVLLSSGCYPTNLQNQ